MNKGIVDRLSVKDFVNSFPDGRIKSIGVNILSLLYSRGEGCVPDVLGPVIRKALDITRQSQDDPTNRLFELSTLSGFYEAISSASRNIADYQYFAEKWAKYFSATSLWRFDSYEEDFAICGVASNIDETMMIFAEEADLEWLRMWKSANGVDGIICPMTWAFSEKDSVYLAARAVMLFEQRTQSDYNFRFSDVPRRFLRQIVDWSRGRIDSLAVVPMSRDIDMRFSQVSAQQEGIFDPFQYRDEDGDPIDVENISFPVLTVPYFPGNERSDLNHGIFDGMNPLVIDDDNTYEWLNASFVYIAVYWLSRRNVYGCMQAVLMGLALLDDQRVVDEENRRVFIDRRTASAAVMNLWRGIFKNPSVIGTTAVFTP